MATESMPSAPGPGRAILYLHPECSKSRAVVDLLRARGIEFERRDFVAQPLDTGELRGLIDALGLPARELVRIDDAHASGLVLASDITQVEVIDLLQAHPVLMQRPVLQVGSRAIIARPPERTLELL